MEYELEKWGNARRSIIEAKSIDEVKAIRDKSEAMRVYAKQIGESLEVQNDVCEIKLRAERRIGEMLKEKPPERDKGSSSKATSLPSLPEGIDKYQSHRYQKIANLPIKTFESLIKDIKDDGKELTETFMINSAKKIERELEINTIRDKIKSGEIELPKGKFEVIVVDPPWKYHEEDSPYDSIGFRGTAPYPTMSVEEIKEMELPTNDDCVLWLWTTHKFMRYSFEILDAWGFEDKSILTWVKNKMGTGRWLRSKSEYCIMAIKGKPRINLTNETTVLIADVKTHSTKPDEFYQMVDKLCDGRKMDYFGRKKREGWTIYGTE